MKIGRLLLNQFGAKSTRRGKLRRRTSASRKLRPARAHFFSREVLPIAGGRVESGDTAVLPPVAELPILPVILDLILAPTAALTSTAVVGELQAREITRVAGSSLGSEVAPPGLTTEALIHPDDQLTRSIEGFLLDQRSPHTQRAYGKDLKRFVRFLAARKQNRGLESFDRTVLIAYKDSLLSENLEHTTIDRHLATLRSFFRWLVDDGYLTKNPAEGVRFLNPKRISRTQAFTDDEVMKLLAKPNLHSRIGAQHYAILSVLFYCGLRRSELCDLRTSNLSEERGHAIFRLRGKGNTERVIVATPPVVKALKHYFRITGRSPTRDQPLFSPIRNNRTGVNEKKLDPSMIFYIVTRYAKAAGIQNRVSPHSCRATAISNARDHQVADRAIQEFAGWASPDMITRYDKRKTAVENSAAHAIQYGDRDRDFPHVREEKPVDESR